MVSDASKPNLPCVQLDEEQVGMTLRATQEG
jgi:hypothetical protein